MKILYVEWVLLNILIHFQANRTNFRLKRIREFLKYRTVDCNYGDRDVENIVLDN